MSTEGLNFNPRLPRGRRPTGCWPKTCGCGISIHASLAGGDWPPFYSSSRCRISIHASLAGGDAEYQEEHDDPEDFNPRLPRGRRHKCDTGKESDTVFQSTPPSREATQRGLPALHHVPISIHASLAGGDAARPRKACSPRHFNPRLPRGRRPTNSSHGSLISLFQSTPPSREATLAVHSELVVALFQSTPPSREATVGLRFALAAQQHFNPRLPRGRRHRTRI